MRQGVREVSYVLGELSWGEILWGELTGNCSFGVRGF
jgi:hypothetical protein